MMFLKEFKKTIMSLTYLIFVGILLLMYVTQYETSVAKIEAPQKGLQSYGVKYEENKEIIIPNAVESLYGEFSANSYIAYPIGFYKNVKLGDKKQGEMVAILSEMTGISKDDLMADAGTDGAGITFGEGDMVTNESGEITFTVPGEGEGKEVLPSRISIDQKLTYERFRELMKDADKLIGGGSKYSNLTDFGSVPMTYEDALVEYKAIVEKDKITGALARVFSDYLGIVLSIFPVFVAVALGLKDRRAKIQELLYTRRISSFRFMFTRYFAMVAALFLPVLLMALYVTVQTANQYRGVDIDLFAFIKYSCGSLLPSIMVSAAVGVCLTVLTDTPIAIAAQGIWWFIGINMGLQHIDGGYGSDLVIRHNKVGNTDVYLDNFNTLVINRISYTLLAIALVALSVWIYELKRRGKLDVLGSIKKIFIHRKVESKA
ncbi:ABC transporter permease [Paenibacillus anaericanus]|uniref:ABC transporter permease n=1 Tax=Paenibacillus anaericanus TaxID=170367 RepID=A0A3S1BP50_9BACL|nr:ABC transporter permease [Paenibacillus anaericanus]RUT46206.1 ABC transporter permease [Paenibacillus anaericanus]